MEFQFPRSFLLVSRDRENYPVQCCRARVRRKLDLVTIYRLQPHLPILFVIVFAYPLDLFVQVHLIFAPNEIHMFAHRYSTVR